MVITKAPVQFRPVSVTLETQDKLDQLLAVLSGVANNRIHHLPQVIAAAKALLFTLSDAVEQPED